MQSFGNEMHSVAAELGVGKPKPSALKAKAGGAHKTSAAKELDELLGKELAGVRRDNQQAVAVKNMTTKAKSSLKGKHEWQKYFDNVKSS